MINFPIKAEETTATLAVVLGQHITCLPHDLYIPPDALEIFLEAFTGPLDLLLYLIKKQNLDILDIPIAEITRQYQQYIELMQELKLELAAEYLLMAAVLAEIKSRLLLPKLENMTEEEDPRAELVRRLKEYEQFKQAAESLDALPRVERDTFVVTVATDTIERRQALPTVSLNDLLVALKEVLTREEWRTPHFIRRELLSVRERMAQILQQIQVESSTPFQCLFTPQEGRLGVVVSLSAILELLKQLVIEMTQAEPYAPIYVKKIGDH